MADFKAGKMSMIALVLATTLVSESMVDAQIGRKKISGAIDIVFIVGMSHPIAPGGYGPEFEALKTAYIKFAEAFDKTRFAIVAKTQLTDTPETDFKAELLLQTLTDDFNAFRTSMQNYIPPPTYIEVSKLIWTQNIYKALEIITSNIFTDATSKRARIVVYICPLKLPDGGIGGVLSKNVWYYTIVRNESFFSGDSDMPGTMYHAKMIAGTGNEKRVVVIQGKQFVGTIDAAMDKVKEAVVRDLCGWDFGCVYLDDKQAKCNFTAWEGEDVRYLYDRTICKASIPTGGLCEKADCEQECDSRWPWDKKPECGCGKVEGRRSKEMPPSAMRFCPTCIVCPPCTTTTPAPTGTPSPAPVEKKVEGLKRNLVVIVVVVVVVGLLVVIGCIIFGVCFFLFIRKRNAERKVTTAKMDAMMETIRHMSIRAVQPGAEAGLAADLMTEKESKIVSGMSKKAGSVKKEVGGVKKMDSIKSGGQRAPIKSKK